MFGPPGIAYVYLVYGMYDCLNVITEPAGRPAAVLIRAVEPVHGMAEMRRRRSAGQKHLPDTALTSGPGKLAQALGITGALDGHRLDRAPLRIMRGPVVADAAVMRGPRIGITRAAAWPQRFWERGNPYV
jgi:DNA-3-methyladenine glycosylase